MEIIGKRLKLRPFQENDIEDYIRWMTVETEWMEWDAPWEEDDFDADAYRNACFARLEKNAPLSVYSTREIALLGTGQHIGRINTYQIDDDFQSAKEGKNLAIGMDIFDPACRNLGFGTEAWLLFIHHLLVNGVEDVYTQTWSGNMHVQALMHKVGFQLVHIDRAYQVVKGQKVDRLTFRLNKDKFLAAFETWRKV